MGDMGMRRLNGQDQIAKGSSGDYMREVCSLWSISIYCTFYGFQYTFIIPDTAVRA